MSEPTNPLFEEEKAFLERKKLEYERALLGDVAQLKEQTANAGRVALVGAGLAGSVWLITKAFGGRKRRHQSDYPADYERAGYGPQDFGDFDFDGDEQEQYGSQAWAGPDEYFGEGNGGERAEYYSDGDDDDNLTASHNDPDDNGLGDYPDFPAHSGSQHGANADTSQVDGHFESEAYGHPESPLPFDDSRRLPESEDFTESNNPIDQYPGRALPTPPARPENNLGSMLVALAKSSAGKVILGQAVSVAMALATKVLKEKLSSNEPETPKSSDLADLTGENDGYAHGHPATPQPDASPAVIHADLSA